MICAYCGVRRGHQTDHLITKNQARRSHAAAAVREDARFKVKSCSFCNEAKGVRLCVPPSHEQHIAELEAITHGTYRVWNGDAESLRIVVK